MTTEHVVYAVPITSEGYSPSSQPPLAYPAGSTGGVQVSATGTYALNRINLSGKWQFLSGLSAICIATGATSGYWTLSNGVSPLDPVLYPLSQYGVVQKLQQPVAPCAPGLSYTWVFDPPIRSAYLSQLFTISPINSDMGTWFFNVQGYQGTP